MPYYPPAGGGGGSFNPHSPGPIGDTTPSTGAFTAVIGNQFGDGIDASGVLTAAQGNFVVSAGGGITASGASSLSNGLVTTDAAGNLFAQNSIQLSTGDGFFFNGSFVAGGGNLAVDATNTILSTPKYIQFPVRTGLTSSSEGTLWYDGTTSTFKYFNGATIKTITAV